MSSLTSPARPSCRSFARHWRLKTKVRTAVFDPVTAADHAAETVMRALIRRDFPDHGIVGEEYGEERADAEYVWVLDPIDGTKSFISGMPAWGTLIALTRFGEPVFGLMNQPFTRERFSSDGGAALYRGPAGQRDLRVRACAALSEAVLFTTSPRLMNGPDRSAFSRVEDAVRLSRYGGDCYAYCMLAAGHVDLVIETGLKPYDVLALVPIIAGAGGIITTWENGSPARRRPYRRRGRQAASMPAAMEMLRAASEIRGLRPLRLAAEPSAGLINRRSPAAR